MSDPYYPQKILGMMPAAPGYRLAEVVNRWTPSTAWIDYHDVIAWVSVRYEDPDGETDAVEVLYLDDGNPHVSRLEYDSGHVVCEPGMDAAVASQEVDGKVHCYAERAYPQKYVGPWIDR